MEDRETDVLDEGDRKRDLAKTEIERKRWANEWKTYKNNSETSVYLEQETSERYNTYLLHYIEN